MTVGINHFCSIKNGRVMVDRQKLYTNTENEDFGTFIKGVYKHFNINYPKFYKMDALCKLAVVATSVLIETTSMEMPEKTALLLANKSSCIDVDKKHLESISDPENYFPSPANFVYTLPNIALGEISIKYKLRSENTFFIFDVFNPTFMVDYTNCLIELNKASEVLCGWVEVNENDYKAIIYRVESGGRIAHEAEEVLKFDSI